MKILTPTNEQKQYFINDNEKLYATYEQENSQGNLALYITNKKVYINSEYNKTIQENIIELNSIEYVNYAQTKIEKSKSSITAIAILLLTIGIALFALLSVIKPIIITAIIISAMGIILLIIGLIINAPKYINKLIIGTAGGIVEISVQEFIPENVKEIQKKIFEAKENA